MIKKKLFLSLMAAPLLFATSCGDDKDTTATYTINCLNMVTTLNSEAPSTVSSGSYMMDQNYTQGTIALSTTQLNLDGATVSFACQPTVPKYETPDSGLSNCFIFPPATATTGSQMSVDNIKFVISDRIYWSFNMENPGIALTSNYNSFFSNYIVNNEYRVQTLPFEAWYGGKTIYTDASGTRNENEDVIFRIILNVQNKKGDVCIYNLKIGDWEKERNIVLKNIPLEYGHGYLGILGTDIAVNEASGTTYTEIEGLKALSFKMTTSGEYQTLGTFEIDFNTGENLYFTGKYADI